MGERSEYKRPGSSPQPTQVEEKTPPPFPLLQTPRKGTPTTLSAQLTRMSSPQIPSSAKRLETEPEMSELTSAEIPQISAPTRYRSRGPRLGGQEQGPVRRQKPKIKKYGFCPKTEAENK